MSNTSTIVFKKNMTIGNQAAETDDFLSDCFVETVEYQELADFSNNKMILIGRTGSGKTALLRQIRDYADIKIDIEPEKFAMEYIVNNPFVLKLKAQGINLEAFHKFLWIHEIASKIIAKTLYMDGEEKLTSKLLRFFSEHSRDNDKLRKLKNYLEKHEGQWFLESFPEKITTEMQTGISGKLGLASSTSLDGKLSETQKIEIQTAANSYVNREQLQQLYNIIELLGRYFQVNSQKKIAVLIDDLDSEWVDEDSKYKLIDALLTAIRQFANIPNLKIVIALRADLHTATCKLVNRQIEKDEAFTIKLHWDLHTLTELLDKRIDHLFYKQYSRRQSVNFEDVFDSCIEGQKASDYILEHSMMRPRDVINFVNACIREADNSSRIEAKHIIAAEQGHRYERMCALSHEWHSLYKHLEHYILSINSFGPSFTIQCLLDNFDDIEAGILSVPSEEDDFLQDIFSKPNVGDEYKIQTLLKALFKIGLVGKTASDESIHYSTTMRPELSDLELTKHAQWVIHPLFRQPFSQTQKNGDSLALSVN